MTLEPSFPVDTFSSFRLTPRSKQRPLEREPLQDESQTDTVSLGKSESAPSMESMVQTFWSQVSESPEGLSPETLVSVAARNLGILTWEWLKKAFPETEDDPRTAVRALQALLRRASPLSHAHSDRVGQLAAALAEELGLDDDEQEKVALGFEARDLGLAAVRLACLAPEERDDLAANVRLASTWLDQAGALHDIGKLHIPGGILAKRGPLTDDEMAIVRLHPVVGEQLLRPIPELGPILPAVRGHHERWDGNGYPDGLEQNGIPLTARILCLADSFDAMTGERPYRKSVTPAEAIAEILRGAGRQFDPELAGHFVRRIAREFT